MAGRDSLGARRKALGLTQESLAELLRVERSTVARWEQGTATPRPWYRRRLADALDLSPDELTRLLDEGGDVPRVIDLATDSRDRDEKAPADAGYVESIREDTRRLVELDTRYGGDDLVHLAVRATKAADEQLAAGTRTRTLESDLQAAVGEMAQVSAWIAYDADQQPLARRLTNEALLHSRMAGDRRLELFELAQLAMQSIHLQRPGEALRIADEVIDNARTGPRVAAVFHLRRARALAQLGDLTGALDEHDRADAILRAGDSSSHDPDWTWWVDDAELAWHRAMSHVSAGDWPQALGQFQAAYEQRAAAAPRSRYNDLAHLLAAQVAVRTWHDTETSLTELVSEAGSFRSARTTALLRHILRQIGRDNTGPPSSILDLGEGLSVILAEADDTPGSCRVPGDG
jgi:transcriptional regulator with XRE-family HTH domain